MDLRLLLNLSSRIQQVNGRTLRVPLLYEAYRRISSVAVPDRVPTFATLTIRPFEVAENSFRHAAGSFRSSSANSRHSTLHPTRIFGSRARSNHPQRSQSGIYEIQNPVSRKWSCFFSSQRFQHPA
jgi:hypothetical protein